MLLRPKLPKELVVSLSNHIDECHQVLSFEWNGKKDTSLHSMESSFHIQSNVCLLLSQIVIFAFSYID